MTKFKDLFNQENKSKIITISTEVPKEKIELASSWNNKPCVVKYDIDVTPEIEYNFYCFRRH